MNPAELHFLRPGWLLALLPLALLLWSLARRGSGASGWQGLVDPHLLPHLLDRGGGRARRAGPWLLGLGWLLLVLALAGPTWERLPQPVYETEQYRVLVLDISRTMDAADLAPSRMAQARFETLDLLRRSDEGQLALIAYGAEPYVISPLTRDADTIALQVPALGSELLPIAGRNAGPALRKALELLRNAGARDGEVILIGDGMDDPATAQAAARELRQAGHRLSVLALGTEQGAPVPNGDGGFLQGPDGGILMARLDPGSLQALADAGGGRYVMHRPDDRDLDALLREPTTPQRTEEQDARLQGDQWRELGPWLLLPLLPLAALAFRRGWFSPLLPGLLALGLLPAPQPTQAFGWEDLWARPDQRGAAAMAAQRPEQAARQFLDPAWRAAAQYQAGNYAESLRDLQGLQGSEPAYNRGNALARLGKLDQAIAAYEQALAADPDHADARFNRELLQRLLDQQQQQQSGQASQSGAQDGGQGDAGRQQDDNPGDSDDSGQRPGARQGRDTDNDPAAAAQQPQPSQDADGESRDQDGGSANDKVGQNGTEAPPTGRSSDTGQDPETDAGSADEPSRGDLTGDRQGEPGSATRPGAPIPDSAEPPPESAQAMEQWLRRVPDDPAGLLRQRILLQHLRNRGELP